MGSVNKIQIQREKRLEDFDLEIYLPLSYLSNECDMMKHMELSWKSLDDISPKSWLPRGFEILLFLL